MKFCKHKSGLWLLVSLLLLSVSGQALAAEATSKKFKVCADGNYMPMSNRNGEGFENRVAALFADKLDSELQYFWFPQRMGFIRNTLRKKDINGESLCDVVMGVPAGYELVKPTRPWYRSAYALAFVPARGLENVHSEADLLALPPQIRNRLKFGMHERNPGVQWLAMNNMLVQLVPYIAQLGDPNVAPGELEGRDLLAGRIDVAVLWGPLAGELKRQSGEQEIRIIPIASQLATGLITDYAIAMGVHFPNGEMAKTLNRLIDENREQIKQILQEYHVPLIEPIQPPGQSGSDDDDDDDDDD